MTDRMIPSYAPEGQANSQTYESAEISAAASQCSCGSDHSEAGKESEKIG
jgi:hypothetical protein